MSSKITRRYGKYTITKVRKPIGSGHQYQAQAGPEGHVIVMDTGNIPVEIYAALVAWDLEKEPMYHTLDPQPEFNKRGWSL